MVTRRRLLATGTSAAAIGAFAAVPFDTATAQAARPRRRRIHELELNDPIVETYRDGVRILREQNGAAISWDTVTTIHGTIQGFNRCPHGNWYFLPWHRAYLVMLEQIIRQVTLNPDFALPYWDWAQDRTLPPQFSDPTYNGQPNALFEERRYGSPTDGIPDEYVGPDVVRSVMDETDFELFGTSRARGQNNTDASWIRARGASGPLERTMHDNIHGFVGGENSQGQPGFMASSMSALDPIFWLHHCNIDRIWAVWNQAGGVNTTSPLWRDMPFANHFLRPDGQSYSARVRDLEQILPLGYRYGLSPQEEQRPSDGAAQIALNTTPVAVTSARTRSVGSGGTARAPAPAPKPRFTAPNQVAAEVGKPLEISVSGSGAAANAAITPRVRAARSVSGAASRPPAKPRRVLVIISDIKQPASPGSAVRVFINGENISDATPVTSPNFVGTFGFFGGEHVGHAGHGDSSIIVDITRTLQALQASGKVIGNDIKVQLVPVSSAKGGKASPIIPGKVEIVVT